MTPPPSPQAEKIAVIAEWMPKWRYYEPNRSPIPVSEPRYTILDNGIRRIVHVDLEDESFVFNPFEDWNHTHMVLDKLMEDKDLWSKLQDGVHKAIRSVTPFDSWLRGNQEIYMDNLYQLIKDVR